MRSGGIKKSEVGEGDRLLLVGSGLTTPLLWAQGGGRTSPVLAGGENPQRCHSQCCDDRVRKGRRNPAGMDFLCSGGQDGLLSVCKSTSPGDAAAPPRDK